MPSKNRSKILAPKMSLIGFVVRLIISMIWDALDFIFGWLPVIGTAMDIFGMILAVLLWGKAGIVYLWEIIAFGPFNVIDGIVPTHTLIGIYVYMSGQVAPLGKGNKRKKRG